MKTETKTKIAIAMSVFTSFVLLLVCAMWILMQWPHMWLPISGLALLISTFILIGAWFSEEDDQ